MRLKHTDLPIHTIAATSIRIARTTLKHSDTRAITCISLNQSTKSKMTGTNGASARDHSTKTVMPSSCMDSVEWTTNQGAPVTDNENSLTAGPRGPVLLEDYHLLEKLAHFDRERIPERVVHARGAVAKGYFEVTEDISDLTFADVLTGKGKKTDVIARFSTVTHPRGSPETLRDPRGFAVKFYTSQGNWDLVGNNMPVFFIRDGIKFPDLIHAFKPSPTTNIQEDWRILDFLSHHPESVHMLTWVDDDVGIPLNYRSMPGFGVHTFKLVNKDGKQTLVKFHWVPKEGDKPMLEEEGAKLDWTEFSVHTKDLYDSIKEGKFPEWELKIQTMKPEDQDKYDFDPMDATVVWPEVAFPLRSVGRMVLNRNVDNFFNENEQLAFSPAAVVPGIAYTQDKLLQSRIFSYADTQRYRLGANYLLLPVNAPRNIHHDNHHEGKMNFMHRNEEINYFNSRYTPETEARRYPAGPEHVEGDKVQVKIPKTNDFAQAGERYRSFDSERQKRFVKRTVKRLAHPRCNDEVRNIWLRWWSKVDADLGKAVAQELKSKLASS